MRERGEKRRNKTGRRERGKEWVERGREGRGGEFRTEKGRKEGRRAGREEGTEGRKEGRKYERKEGRKGRDEREVKKERGEREVIDHVRLITFAKVRDILIVRNIGLCE